MSKLEKIKNGFSFIKEQIETLIETPSRNYISSSINETVFVNKSIIERANKAVNLICKDAMNESFMLHGNYKVREYSLLKDKKFSTEENAEMTSDNMTIASSKNFLSKLTDDELIFVMAHEIAHAEFHHGNIAERLSKLSDDKEALLKFSRVCEHDADLLGTYFAVNVGVSVDSCLSFFDKMSKISIGKVYVGMTHPSTAERKAFIKDNFSDNVFSKLKRMKNLYSFMSHEGSDKEIVNILNTYFVKRADDLQTNYKNIGLDYIREYIKEDPQRRGMQTYLDTKDLLSCIHMQNLLLKTVPGLVPDVIKFSKKQLEMGENLANEVLNLPEMAVFRGFGMRKNLAELKAKDRAKEIRKGRV